MDKTLCLHLEVASIHDCTYAERLVRWEMQQMGLCVDRFVATPGDMVERKVKCRYLEIILDALV
jgi:hypothetical protein